MSVTELTHVIAVLLDLCEGWGHAAPSEIPVEGFRVAEDAIRWRMRNIAPTVPLTAILARFRSMAPEAWQELVRAHLDDVAAGRV